MPYALDIAGQVGDYPIVLDAFGNPSEFPEALHAAYDELRITEVAHVTVVLVEGEGQALAFTPLVTVTPPITPPSTSPEALRE